MWAFKLYSDTDRALEIYLADIRHESELDALRSGYESRIEDLERNVERLQNEKQTLIADRQEKQELVEYVETEKSLTEKKAQAGALTRARWWLTGMPDDD